MEIIFSENAFTQLLKLEKNTQKRIGDYRIIFDIEGDKIIILKIGHRRDIYK